MTKNSRCKTVPPAKPKVVKPPQSKTQQVIDMLSRDEGTSIDELCQATNWQPHSARAFLTGLEKKGYSITSDKVDGVRRYHDAQVAKVETA